MIEVDGVINRTSLFGADRALAYPDVLALFGGSLAGATTLGASATVGGLCHAAERRIR